MREVREAEEAGTGRARPVSRFRRAGRAALAVAAVALVLLALLELVLRAGVAVISQQSLGGAAGAGTTILCIGDSFTFGIGVARGEKYPALLERRLRELPGGERYRVVNLGRPGTSSGYVLASLEKWLRRYRPACVVLMTGWNCNDHDFAQYRARTGRGRGLAWARARFLLGRLAVYRLARYELARLRATPDEAVYPEVMSMELYDFRDYQRIAMENVDAICEKLRRAGVPLVLLTYPEARPPANPRTATEYYHYIFGKTAITDDDYLLRDRGGKIAVNAIVARIAANRALPLADNAEAFRGAGDVFIPGDHHPNAVGNRIIADTAFAALERAGLATAAAAAGRREGGPR
jgi:lysophospholipase L1-like esterase